MVSFPNAKINLGLNIIGKRSDGFHNLQTVFYPIDLKDVLEIVENKDKNDISFSQSGLIINGEASNNLCIKAYHLLKNKYPTLPSIKLHLHKSIPMGAGLGGGSADAAFTLDLEDIIFRQDILNYLSPSQSCFIGVEFSKYYTLSNRNILNNKKQSYNFLVHRYGKYKICYQNQITFATSFYDFTLLVFLQFRSIT